MPFLGPSLHSISSPLFLFSIFQATNVSKGILRFHLLKKQKTLFFTVNYYTESQSLLEIPPPFVMFPSVAFVVQLQRLLGEVQFTNTAAKEGEKQPNAKTKKRGKKIRHSCDVSVS